MPDIRAQNESLRGPPWGCGALRLLPVAALYLARPFAVKPAPLETGSFSPRPTARDGPFFLGAALAIEHRDLGVGQSNVNVGLKNDTISRNDH